ncbi:hypothetical protein OIU76_023091 [Salix suchowensis]|nr:hypothetical protein OIU76_023091 [Salix suchowensis]
MFLATLSNFRKLSIPFKPKLSPLAFLSTHPQNQPHQELPLNHQQQNICITNRSYWNKKIHDLCTKHRNVDEALRLLDHLRLRGYLPDPLNLSSIIHGLCDANRFNEAHQRLIIFLTSLCVPDERTCNVLIARLLHSKDPFRTFNIIHRLIEFKPEFVPSLINYNRLIDQFCSVSLPNVAHRMLYDMINRGHCPNTVSYTTLVSGYCKIGELSDAYKLFDEMPEWGVVPNSLTYSLLIRGVLRKRDIERGRELMHVLFQVMRYEEDQSVNSAAFANLVDCLCREGLFNEVFMIAEEMPQGNRVNEDFAFGHLIDSLCKVGRSHGASRVVYIMRKKGFTPSIVSYNSIIHGLCKEGGCMRAYQLLEEGLGFGYLLSEYTYKVLVEALCQAMDLDKAREVLKAMLSEEGMDRTRIYNIYLRALCLMNNPTELLNVLVSMLQTNSILKGLCRSGYLNEAIHFLYELVDSGVNPNIVSYNIVIDRACSLGMKREAYQIVGEMQKNGLNPDAVTWRTLDKLHGHVKNLI